MAFTNFSIEAGKHAEPPVENILLGLALLVVIFVSGTLSFIQEIKRAQIARKYEENTVLVISE